jgi:hypothetical protein
MTTSVENGISPSRQYRVIMMTETSERVTRIVTLPVSVPNTPANVEVWYAAYVPKGHLLVDIEPV